MKHIVVVGGGITGLCTMHYLQKSLGENAQQFKFTLVEKKSYLGGKIHSEHKDGFIMETGADSMVARHPGVLELVRELNFESELVYNETGISYIHTNNELHAIPAGSTFGIPMSVESLQASTLVSEEGKVRALKDLELPNPGFTKETSIGQFLEYFFGEELVKKQIAPVLAGVYSGDLYQLSLNSTLPYLVDYKDQYGSIIKGFEANRSQFEKAANKKFISFKGGLLAFIDELEQKLNSVEVLKGVGLAQLHKQSNRYRLLLDNGESLQADYVVLALPNNVVAQVVDEREQFGDLFNQFTTASAITMYVGYDVPDSVLPADGTGFIVSHNSDLVCNASTWTSRKWKHTSANGNLLVRLFYKSVNPRYEELKAMSDEELLAVAKQDIEQSLGIQEVPVLSNVTRWIDQMPKYDLAHNEALSKLVAKFEEVYPNVQLAGCSYFGVGIGACIANGKVTGERIAASLLTE